MPKCCPTPPKVTDLARSARLSRKATIAAKKAANAKATSLPKPSVKKANVKPVKPCCK